MIGQTISHYRIVEKLGREDGLNVCPSRAFLLCLSLASDPWIAIDIATLSSLYKEDTREGPDDICGGGGEASELPHCLWVNSESEAEAPALCAYSCPVVPTQTGGKLDARTGVVFVTPASYRLVMPFQQTRWFQVILDKIDQNERII